MRRILFVDDEPKVLEGLQRMLRPQRDRWEMRFACGGEAALAELSSGGFDVIVSDMRMPGMDGATLLEQVRARYPNVVRMVLTGHTSLEAALRAVPVAHQFLSKPCDPVVLRVAVERACNLKSLLSSEQLCKVVAGMEDLPALPRTYAALSEALTDPEVSLDKLTAIVEQDVAISAKILQLVNSPFFGVVRTMTSIREAVAYLGTDILRNLVLSIEAFRMFDKIPKVPDFSIDELQAHSQRCAKIASKLPTEGHLKDAAQVGALLHDLGKLIVASRLPNELVRVQEAARQRKRPWHEVEQELLGVTHAEIGAYLLGLWGLPYAIVEAVAYHHVPARVPSQGFDSVATVYVANILAHENEKARNSQTFTTFDFDYLRSLGAEHSLPAWRAKAADVVQRLEAG
jgi:HD-like signal output (HDOD) protein